MSSPSADALAHYLSLARLASADSAAQLCVHATEDPNLYVFGELLSMPAVLALRNHAAYDKFFQLVRLFAHGTMQHYLHNRGMFPPLSEPQLTKLRTLTLVSLAHAHSELKYDALREALAVHTIRQVEDVVIDAVYAGLLRARMNQQARTVEISAVEGRDVVMPDGIEPMVTSLNVFLARATQLVSQIDAKIEFIATNTNKAKEQKQRAAAELHALRSQVRAESSRELKHSRLRNKAPDVTSTEEDMLHFYRRDTRSMRARRYRSSDADA